MCISNINRSKRQKCPDPSCMWIATTMKHNCPLCNRVLVDARGTIAEGRGKVTDKDYRIPGRVPWDWEPEYEEYEKNRVKKVTRNAYIGGE